MKYANSVSSVITE